jgi:proline dehydrogenase
VPRTHDTPEHYGFRVLIRTRRRTDDLVEVVRGLVADGCGVALELLPGDDVTARIAADGLAPHCEVTLDVDRLGAALVRDLAAAPGLAVAVSGTAAVVDDLAGDLPEVRVVVRADEPLAEARCRALASRRVRLVRGRPARRRRPADLTFVRCLNVLMAGNGRPAIAAADPRLIAIAGERAAWNGRTPDSWEHVLPYGVLIEEQQRLVAGGCAVRVAVGSAGSRA